MLDTSPRKRFYMSLRAYKKAGEMMGKPSLSHLKDEWQELLSDKSLEELVDVIHTLARLLGLPSWIIYFLAYPTAKKHADRVRERGCPRSERACREAGPKCCCLR